MAQRLIDLSTMPLPDARLSAWLQANSVDPRDVAAESEVLVTDTHIAAIGWVRRDGVRILNDAGQVYLKSPVLVPLTVPPEQFGL